MTRLALVLVVAVVLSAQASAAWSRSSTGLGVAAAKTMPAGNAPGATASGFTVTVTWTASSFPQGGTVSSYRIRRFDALGNPSNAANGCSGTVASTSCVETGVPAGAWRYAVTPAIGAWTGAEGPHGTAVVVTGL
jgi:hypothetical protein